MAESVGSEVAASVEQPESATRTRAQAVTKRRSRTSRWRMAGAALVSAAGSFAGLQAAVTGPISVHQELWISVAALAAGAGGAGASLGAQQVLKLWAEHFPSQGTASARGSVTGGGACAPEPAPVRLIPPFRRLFVDRAEALAWIARAFRVPGDGIQPTGVALIGLSGIGKSRLALEYVSSFQSRYDVVAWVPANDQEQIAGALHALAAALDVPAQTTTAQTVRLVWRALAARRRWLLVFDSAVDAKSLLPWWPTAVNGDVIVTSTRRDWSQFVDAQYTLDSLAPDHGAALLRAIDEHADADSARAVAERLGGLPLELTRAASYAVAAGLPLTRAASGKGSAVQDSDDAWIAELSVLESDAPRAHLLLRLIARAAASGIPRTLLTAAASGNGGGETDVDAALAELAGRSLIELDERSATIHPRYQEVIRGHFNADRAAAVADCARLLRALLAAFERFDGPGHFDECAAHAPHALVVLGTSRVVGAAPALRFALALRVGEYLHLRDQLDAAERTVKEALADAAFIEGREGSLLQSRALAELSVIRFHRADLAGAYEAATQSAESARESGNEKAGCMALLALAQVEREQEQYSSALAHYRDAAAAAAAAGDEEISTRVLANQGLLKWRMGDFEGSLHDSLRAYELYRGSVGPESPEAVHALDAAGLAARDLGRADYAVELLQEAAEAFEHVHGPRAQESTLKAREHLGSALLRAGRAADAGAVLESVLALREEMLGSDHPNIGEVCGYLAEVRLRTGEYEQAEAYAARAHRILLALLGPDHRYTRQAGELIARIAAARASGRTA